MLEKISNKYKEYDLSNFNIRYLSKKDDIDIGIFIANFKNDTLYDIQTFSLTNERSYNLSKDLVEFYQTIYDRYSPNKLEFTQQEENKYAYNLMLKLCDKFRYVQTEENFIGSGKVKYTYKKAVI